MTERPASGGDRLARQLAFILEIDRLKGVLRRSYLIGADRLENSAEHSWHLAMLALLLEEYADEPIRVESVVRMVLIHDIVEIDAGDTYRYDEERLADQHDREVRAAERLFGLLPEDQAVELRALWDEFERRETAEARFAHAVDHLMPLLHNYHTGGRAWREHGIRASQVLGANEVIREGSKQLWALARELIGSARERGDFVEEGDEDGSGTI